MSRSRHQKKAAGGTVKPDVYAGAGSNVLKEAEERKHGGKVKTHGEGEKAKERADRPKRARGGRLKGEGVGANLTPLSTASKIKEVEKGEIPEDGEKSD